jgi:endonuclease/exonuclease/phosphatase family metal-dependent hydrolase
MLRLVLLVLLVVFLPAMSCHRPTPPPETPQKLRVATYNVSFFSDAAGGLEKRLRTGDPKARQIAAVIQRARPDVLLLNEFDYEPGGHSVELFLHDYLGVSQGGAEAIDYRYRFQAPVNTGVPSGLDLDNDGRTDGPADAWGFGLHPGEYGMLVLSRYPIDAAALRSFQHFLWKDLPGALQPIEPGASAPYYSEAVWSQLRLSSKSHWDLPIDTPLGRLHFLVMHPTPPVFDGPEDRNGRRNHDEIRLMADYIDPTQSHYLTDDQGARGGLAADAAFVIAGDLNCDPIDGDSRSEAIRGLLAHPRVNGSFVPKSPGGAQSPPNPMKLTPPPQADPSMRTSSFGLRVDYVLPSRGWKVLDGAVWWPAPDDPEAAFADASDHHLVWLDLGKGD